MAAAGQRHAFGHHRLPGDAGRAQGPFDQADQPQAPRAAAQVGNHDTHLLDRQHGVHTPAGLHLQLVVAMADRRQAQAMLDHVVGVGLACAGAQAPGLAAAQVLHEIGFAVGVGHRVVRPGGELVQSAVAGPTTADTALRDMGTEIGIGQHVDPRPSRPLGGVDGEAVGAAVGVEAAARRASGCSPVGQAGRGGGPGQPIL